MDCSTPGLPVLHYFPEFVQTHVHWVDDAIQLSHAQSFPSSPALSLSQHQGLFKWVSISHQVAKVLELQHPIFPVNNHQWFPLGLTGLISLLYQGLSRVHFFFFSIFILLHTLICWFFLLFIRWISKPLILAFFKDFYFLKIILILLEYGWFTMLYLFQMYSKVI